MGPVGRTGPAAAGSPLKNKRIKKKMYTTQTELKKDETTTYSLGLPGPAETPSLLVLCCELDIWSRAVWYCSCGLLVGNRIEVGAKT